MAGRSGTATTGRTVRAGRGRPVVNISLSAEALARLDAIAAERGQTRSGAVEQLVRNARVREAK
jgi:metal-responsive CopG/Arc/MetJ family transcriptional regulator